MRKQISTSFQNGGGVAEIGGGLVGYEDRARSGALHHNPLSLPIDGRDVAGRCLVWLMSDACWQDFGYARRPARGRIARIFMPKRFEAQESFLRRELLSLITAAYFAAGCLSDEELPEVVSLYAADPLLFQPLGFDSPAEVVRYFSDTLAAYLAVPVGQWHAVLMGRGRVHAAGGIAFHSRFEKGCIKLGERLVSIVGRLSVLVASRHLER